MQKNFKSSLRQVCLKSLLKFNLNTVFIKELFTQFRKKVDFGFLVGFTFTIGPGPNLMKEIDVETVDMNEWATVFDGVLKKWLKEHPETGIGMAEEIVSLVEEYGRLSWK